MAIDLLLRPTIINGNCYAEDFVVWWRWRQFGRRKVGRIMKAHGMPSGSPEWRFHITVPLPVRSSNGRTRSLDLAKAGFRRAFERFERETPDRVFARLYCVPSMHDKQQKAAWLAKFDDPIPLPEGGSIKTLSDARAHAENVGTRAAGAALARCCALRVEGRRGAAVHFLRATRHLQSRASNGTGSTASTRC